MVEEKKADGKEQIKPVKIRDATKEEEEWVTGEIKGQKALGDYYVKQAEKYKDIFTAVYGIFTGLLLLFGLMNANVLKIIQLPWVFFFLLPILAWVGGIFFFFRVMQPSIEKMPPNSPNEIRKALYKSNLTKAENYRNGLWLFGIGVILILVPLGIGAWAASLPPNTPTGDVQLVIKDTGMQYITQIPIELVPGTKKTVVVSLRNTTATSYSIRLNNGDTVDLEKGWIQAVIWKTNETRQDSQQSATPGMANPASVSCDQAGGAVEINKDAAGNEYGMCTFKNGTSCEEWALFRGEGCKPGLTATPADQEKNMVMFTEADNGKTEDVIQDTQFGVVLAENPSTGFAWNATLSSGLELQSDDYQDDTSAGRVGAGGNHTWVINVKEPGDQKFSAVYKRSWEPVRGNETTYSINIRVGKA